jgi:hypothetical protein
MEPKDEGNPFTPKPPIGSITPTKQDYQREQLKKELQNLPTRIDLARLELQRGVEPKWVSVKYGIDLDRCLNYVRALDAQREAKAERERAIGGGDGV